MTTIVEHEANQMTAANASGRPPVVFIPGLWLLPCSWDRWAALFEEAGLYPVPHSTLRDWTAQGRIRALRTPGGHRRYRESDALALLAELIAAAA